MYESKNTALSSDDSVHFHSQTETYNDSWSCDLEEQRAEIEKPQLKFEPRVDNSDSPFKPSLRRKPNAIRPLQIYKEFDKDGTERYCHPYMHELNCFKVPEHQLKKSKPIPPSSTSIHHAITLVDDEKSLMSLCSDLRTVTEIAIDSEYHSFRSFLGFTCLLQISTRTKDYIIDAIALRSKLEVLNDCFTNPKILKVMHAAHSDVIWLQKDLNLYLVNLFDTSLAASKLGSRQSGLASLLRKYCNVEIEKSKEFQKYFDWRLRPLPTEALLYSQDDTHYLLYLHDILRNELITKANDTQDLLMKVYNESMDLCKKTFQKPSSESGLSSFLRKCNKDGKRIHAMKLLYTWRDKIAREMDESTGYILPNRTLQQIVQRLPETIEDLEDCFWPNVVSPVVQKNLAHVRDLILEALQQPTDVDTSKATDKKAAVVKTCSRSTQTDDENNVRIMSDRATQTEDDLERR